MGFLLTNQNFSAGGVFIKLPSSNQINEEKKLQEVFTVTLH